MKKIVLTCAIISACYFTAAVFSGCQKNEEVREEYVYDNPKVFRFLSIILQMPVETIKIDYATHEFYIPNSQFRRKIADVEKDYANANEYKLVYEK